MLIPSYLGMTMAEITSLSRRVNANSQLDVQIMVDRIKLIKKGEC